MSLNFKIRATYKGTNDIESKSPVFDSINIPMEAPGKLIGQPSLSLVTFFLVYESYSSKKLMWIPMTSCYLIEEIPFHGKGLE